MEKNTLLVKTDKGREALARRVPELGPRLRSMLIMVDGQPEKTLKAGDSWTIPPGVPHDAKAGPAGAKVIAVYVVEKGKPGVSKA